MNIAAIVQARVGSTRLPGKVLKNIGQYKAIELLIKRLRISKNLNNIILATTKNEEDNELVFFVKKMGLDVYRGSEKNVLERYIKAAKKFNVDQIVRITGDCPFVDPDLVDQIIRFYIDNNYDYVSNTLEPTFPDGLDIEIFSLKTLTESSAMILCAGDKEHVTSSIYKNNLYTKFNYKNSYDLSFLRWTLDEIEDLETLNRIFTMAKKQYNFEWKELVQNNLNIIKKISTNNGIGRNEGMKINTGQKLYKRAKKIIPGGTMLLSKRPEMFLPEKWPSYFSRAQGCQVWDMDNNAYLDMSIMGIGTNILGYGHPEVDKAVLEAVNKGNMSTFNCPEEVFLAEKLIEINSWADMVRFARSGGEANAIAIRIARAASGRDNVAICGYHGWHDWYLSANLSDKDDGLGTHLLPGLDVKGVPHNLKNTVFPFNYNCFDELERLITEKNIGVIKMEVERNRGPDDNFLFKVREIATANNIVLVFDECTSGFRETYGGLAKKYNIEPDLSMFGKALGNGYAITAVVGKKEIMEATQNTFISSTFWTERIGPVAALKTLEIMEKIKSWEIISDFGDRIKRNWEYLSDLHKIEINITGLRPLPAFSFKGPHNMEYKTFVTQEMLKKGILAASSIYVSICHDEKIMENYFNELDTIFNKIKKCEEGKNIYDLLETPVSHSGFSRLN